MKTYENTVVTRKKHPGRSGYPESKQKRIIRLYNSGEKVAVIAEKEEVSVSTIMRIVRKNRREDVVTDMYSV